jgi:predicted transcriptional regulator
MTDTSIRVSSETRRRLNIYAAENDITQDKAIQQLLDEVNNE